MSCARPVSIASRLLVLGAAIGSVGCGQRVELLEPPAQPITVPEVAYWSFDDYAGDNRVADDSGHGNAATAVGLDLTAALEATPWGQGVRIGTGVLRVEPSPSLDSLAAALSVTAWFNLEDTDQGNRVIVGRQRAGELDSFWFGMLAGRPAFGIMDGVGVQAIADLSPPLGEWHHLAGTWDGSVVRLYYDGSLVATEVTDAPLELYPRPLTLGSAYNSDDVTYPPGEQLDGVLDEVHLFAGTLTPLDIALLSAPPG